MIVYKSRRDIDKMRVSGRVIARIFEMVAEALRPGVTTAELDRMVEDHIRRENGVPSFKGYHGFPGSICASVNEEVVHGIPGSRVLEEGDLFTIDVGVQIKGFHADAARSYPVGGRVPPEVDRLARATARGLQAGIEACRVGARLSELSGAVEAVGKEGGFGVVEDYVGHGIGRQLHEEPQVPNYVNKRLLSKDLVFRSGLVIAIEPMFNLGGKGTKTLSDGWTVVTADGQASAHFEDTVAITDDGWETLTREPGGELLLGWS